MDFEKMKITDYKDSVSALPDYPSDAGYTAAQLKAVFDGRTDKEIKEKFNALLDELKTRFDGVTIEIFNEIMRHNGDDVAHMELFEEKADASKVNADISAIETELAKKVDAEEIENILSGYDLILQGKANATDLDKKVDKIAGKGLSTNDFTNQDKNIVQIMEFHYNDFENPHAVTPEQIGAITRQELDEALSGIDVNIDLSNYYTKEETDNFFGEYIPPLENDISALDERVGNIDSALDELHAYAVALAGGEA